MRDYSWLRNLDIDQKMLYARALLIDKSQVKHKWFVEMVNITGPKSRWNPDSEDAWHDSKGSQTTRFVMVTRAAARAWERGITINEMKRLFRLRADNQISATISKLKAIGVLVPTDRRRLTENKSWARVLVLSGLEKAYENYKEEDEDIKPLREDQKDCEVWDEDGDPVI